MFSHSFSAGLRMVVIWKALFHVSFKATLSLIFIFKHQEIQAMIYPKKKKESELLVSCWELYYCEKKNLS